MGLKDVFSRRSGSQDAPVRDDEPGAVSSQLDGEGRGPVTLDERTGTGGQASPDTNQGKTEPMPATPGQPDPNAEFEPPSLGEMNVGGADPQLSSAPLARPRDIPVATEPPRFQDPGRAPQDDRPALDPASTTELPEGPERPEQATDGTARRAPGSLGDSPEQQETDVDTGAANMRVGGGPASRESDVQPGDAQQVPVPHEVPAPGTSETAPAALGARTPEAPSD